MSVEATTEIARYLAAVVAKHGGETILSYEDMNEPYDLGISIVQNEQGEESVRICASIPAEDAP